MRNGHRSKLLTVLLGIGAMVAFVMIVGMTAVYVKGPNKELLIGSVRFYGR